MTEDSCYSRICRMLRASDYEFLIRYGCNTTYRSTHRLSAYRMRITSVRTSFRTHSAPCYRRANIGGRALVVSIPIKVIKYHAN
jgi:hypothetical protein